MNDDYINHILVDLPFETDFKVTNSDADEIYRRITEAPLDISAALEKFKPLADEYQKEVISSSGNTIRVVAPAGSGKTQTIINRIFEKIKSGSHPSRLLVLTFDNSAVTSLKEKFVSGSIDLGITIHDLQISTLNAFGYSILRNEIPHEFKPVVPNYRQIKFIREILDALKTKDQEMFKLLPSNIKFKYYLEFFGLLKNELFDPRNINPEEFFAFFKNADQAKPFLTLPFNSETLFKITQCILWLYQAYEIVLRREKFIDFDDQKLRAFVELSNNNELSSKLKMRYEEIIVDEFQDINRLDFELIKLIAQEAALVVTGDDDQAIYGFRGCSPDYIIDLESHLNRKIISYELHINYRCPANVVAYADKLIRNNIRRIPKEPIPFNKESSNVQVVSTISTAIESKAIVSYIKKLRAQNRTLSLNDFAILYRTNAQSLPLQIEFILSDIPYYVREEDNILHNDMLQRALAVLRVKCALEQGVIPKPKDAALTIRAYFQYLRENEFTKLQQLFAKNSNYFDVVSSDNFYRILPKAQNSNLIRAMREIEEARTLLDTISIMSKRFKGLEGMIGSLEDVLDQQVPLGELFEIAANFSGNIRDFIDMMDLAIYKATSSNAGRDNKTGVGLLTYFRAKGRQWHTVMLTTCNEGLIPHSKAPIEDERRLFYVALTRASSNLFISYVHTSCNIKLAPSRFLLEAGLIHI